MSKVKTLTVLKNIISKYKKQKKKVIFTNGCFDILHPGHIKVFKEAKKKGDVLVLGLNSDSSIKKIKGKKRPILNEKSRIEVLNAIEYIDYIIVFQEDTPYNLIKELKPHYLVKGGDWKEDEIIGKEFVQKVFRVKLCPGQSTSSIIKKIKKLNG
jgi:D-beta-D-heptose 7-phosphate kinase/D-beta-D-heptose 1-phosphate adenosyltransferase